MARRKSVCVKWTLVVILVLFSSFVYSRPQENSASITTESSIEQTETSAENVIRYNDKFNISYRPLFVTGNILLDKNNSTVSLLNYFQSNNFINYTSTLPSITNRKERQSRLIDYRNINKNLKSVRKNNKLVPVSTYENKPVIKKVVTKWTDKAKYEDLRLSNEVKMSFDSDMYPNSEDYSGSTEDDIRPVIKYQYNVPNNNKLGNHHRPKPQYSTESQVYSSNVQIYDNHPYSFTRPSYMFTTPTPTPIITNVGYPKPWTANNYHVYQPTTRKPVKPTRPKHPFNHNNYHNHSPHAGPNFEASTIKSQPSYTDRIVIRPEEYNASPYDCPTIFLSLNNTFQGEGKEACPDLNIAVNTNVINKNNVIETEEETDTTLTDIFGLPFGESESEESPNINESTETYENQDQTEDASIEGQSLTNYNAANEISDEVSISSANLGQFTSVSRPKRPGKKKKDTFGLSSLINYFQPVVKGFSWLAAINPLSFSAVSFILTPLILLVAGVSAFATVFSPFSYARDASVDPNSPPHWQWDDYYKTWYWNTFSDHRLLKAEEEKRPTMGKDLKSPECLEWLSNTNNWLRLVIEKIKKFSDETVIRKRRRRKRETWAIRVR